MHAADLRRRAQVHAGADLRAGADQGVGIDQRLVADVGPDVHEHRRHADDAAAEPGAIAHGRAARNEPHRRPGADRLERKRVLVEERPPAVIGRHVDRFAEAKAEQDAALHPGVHLPAAGRGRIRLRGADRPLRQCRAQRGERLPRFVARRVDSGRRQAIHDLLERWSCHAGTPPLIPSDCSTASIFCFEAGRGGTIGSR